MPISENTFADKLGRGNVLHSAISGFAPPFTPTDPANMPPAYRAMLDGIEAKNSAVLTGRNNYTTGSGQRLEIVKDLKNRTSMTMNFVNSVTEYKPYKVTVRNIVKKILNYRVPKPKLPEGAPEPKKRNKGEQSFADIAGLFKSLISALGSIAGYMPFNDSLKIASMTTLHTSLVDKNTEMDALANALGVLIGERLNLYTAEGTGLKDRMISIKNAVRAQYGNTSPEYLSVKGIKV